MIKISKIQWIKSQSLILFFKYVRAVTEKKNNHVAHPQQLHSFFICLNKFSLGLFNAYLRWVAVKFPRAYKISRRDLIAGVNKIAQRYFCKKTLLHGEIFARVDFLFFYFYYHCYP